MRRGTKVFLALVLLLLLGFGAAGAISVWFFLKPSVEQDSLLVVNLSGSLVEHDTAQELRELFGERVFNLSQLINAIIAAKDDDRIQGLLFVTGSPGGLDPAKAYEIRAAIEEFRQAGKPTHAYIEFASTLDYYLASACENLYVMPQGEVWTTGYFAAYPFLRGTLDKVRIRPDFRAYHEYKTASDMYRRREMSDAGREQMDALMDTWWRHLVDGVATSRRLEPEAVEAIFDRSPLVPDEALEAGFVDAVLYWDQVKDRMDGAADGSQDAAFTPVREYARTLSGGKSRIAVVYAIGTILPGESQESLFGGSILGSGTISRAIREAREDDGIKAIVLRVDSPGGSAVASEEIRREVARTRDSGKPIVVSMSWVAASGGYWISMAADEIVAGPTTVTGSIGVVAGKLDWSGFYDWIGMNFEHMSRGRNAGMLTDTQGFTDSQAESLEKWMTYIYEDFIGKVAEGRELPEEQVREIAKGRVWSGEDALRQGLVDRLGGLREAIAAAKERAGIPASEQVRVTTYPRPETLWESLFGDATREPKIEGLPAPIRKALQRAAVLEAWEHERVLALDPMLWDLQLLDR
jgi:protease-4